MKRCTKCVLNENYPGINFDENGVCNYCNRHKKIEEQKSLKEKYKNKFLDLVEKYRGKNQYDCLVGYSGGKDSTYTLYLLKEIFGLNILALRYDNWFQSNIALKNIERVVKELDVELLTVKPNYKKFKKIMQAAAVYELYPTKSLSRASSICTTCISLIRFVSFKTAIEKEIPFVVFGMSPGQAPIVTSIVKTNPDMVRNMQNIIYQPLHKYLGSEIDSFFIQERHFKREEHFPYNINPLAFLNYDEKEIERIQNILGWEKPKDTDANSTNCLLNALANNIHINKYGYHPYAYELSELILNGVLSRDIAMEKINSKEDKKIIELMKEKLEIK
jgi:3'-phosphoadenosine 5'-phosphosulfate sulfotransferase (PAPS reductase)/FAD synthetase